MTKSAQEEAGALSSEEQWVREEIEAKHASLSTGTFYDWLEVRKTASTRDIKKAFSRLVKKYHPDRQRSKLLDTLSPKLGDITDDSRPYGMAVDKNDRIWIVETGMQPNRLVGFDSASSSFLNETDIPSGADSVRHMYYNQEELEHRQSQIEIQDQSNPEQLGNKSVDHATGNHDSHQH